MKSTFHLMVMVGVMLFCRPMLFAADSERPNIIILFADDLGYGELRFPDDDPREIPTPHLDDLADGGIRCTNAYVTAAYCSPSRAGLLTGRIPARFGYEFNPVGMRNEDPKLGLPLSETTLADALERSGYATSLVGKWHLGGTASYYPLFRGFEEFFGFLHEGHFFVPPPYEGVVTMLRRHRLPDGTLGRWQVGNLVLSTHMGHHEPAYDACNPIYRGGQPVVEEEYLTDAFAREATDFIRRTRKRPFFLYLAFNAVHSPLQCKLEDMERFSEIDDVHRRIFAAMLACMDDAVGDVMKTLRELGLEENTLVFFLSDNGGPTRELTSSNLPLRGEKGHLYEGGIRIPFFVQWKKVLPEGGKYPRPVSSLDIYPTALAAAGEKDPQPRRRDGVNLLPYLLGKKEEPPHQTLYWRQGNRTALRSGDWKLVRNPPISRQWELYHLAEDIDESEDLAEKEPEKLKSLIEKWRAYDVQMPTRYPMP